MKTPIEEAGDNHAARLIKEGVLSEDMRSGKAYQFKNTVTSPEAEAYYRAKFLEERESSLKDKKIFYESEIKSLIKEVSTDKMSFGKMVEILNEKVKPFLASVR